MEVAQTCPNLNLPPCYIYHSTVTYHSAFIKGPKITARCIHMLRFDHDTVRRTCYPQCILTETTWILRPMSLSIGLSEVYRVQNNANKINQKKRRTTDKHDHHTKYREVEQRHLFCMYNIQNSQVASKWYRLQREAYCMPPITLTALYYSSRGADSASLS